MEVNLGIICGSAMRLKPLIKRYLPQLGLFSSRTHGSEPYGSRGTGLDPGVGKSQHKYQLHSIQNGSVNFDSGNKHGNRFDPYTAHGEHSARDDGSTDKILA